MITLGSELKVGGTNLLRIANRFNDFSSFEDYLSANKLVIAIIETLLAGKLLSLFIMLTSCKTAPVLTNSTSNSYEFLARFPKAAAAFDRVFSSESLSNDTRAVMDYFNCE